MGGTSARLYWKVMLLCLLVSLGPGRADARAQSLTRVQDLDFGTVVPGITQVVAPTDAWRRGEWRFDLQGKHEISFVLPTQLTTLDAVLLPISFGAGDACLVLDRTGGTTCFDPRVREVVNFNRGQGSTGSLRLGGTIVPAPGQPAGAYSSTIIVVITNAGV